MFTKYKLNDSPSNFRKSHEISASNKLLSSYAQKITWGAQNAPPDRIGLKKDRILRVRQTMRNLDWPWDKKVSVMINFFFLVFFTLAE